MSPDKNKPIVVAGKKYASVEEMPAEVRRVYDLAVAARNQEHAEARVKLVFNGREYDSLESMPADVRKLYQTQQVAMETYRDFSVDATKPRAARVGSETQRELDKLGSRRLSPLQMLGLILIVAGVLAAVAYKVLKG